MEDADLSGQVDGAMSTVVDKLQLWLQGAIEMLPNFAVAVLVVLFFGIAARLTRKGIRRLMSRTSDNEQIISLLSAISYAAVLTAGVFVALGVLNLSKTVTSLLAGVGILGLALGFAFQDIAANFVSGVLLAFRRPFSVGDAVEANGIAGVVERTDLRTTVLRQFDGKPVFIPNKDVYSNPIVNMTDAVSRRIEISCGVGYEDDLEKAQRTVVEAVKGVSLRDQDTDVQFFYDEFGASSINFKVRFWISYSDKERPDYFAAQNEAIIRVKKALDEGGFNIPFPIRTLEFANGLDELRGMIGNESVGMN